MSKFKVGDTLRCKPGFQTNPDYGNDHGMYTKHGGTGYKSLATFEVRKVETGNYDGRGSIYWPMMSDPVTGIVQGCYIYEQALELAVTPCEINNNYSIF